MKKTKKLLCVFLSLVMMLTLSVPAFAGEEAKTKFVVLGDSIAQGYGLKSISTQAYGALISEAEGYAYVNHAIGGHTTYNLNSRLEEQQVAADVADADIIAISIGGNNFLLGGMIEMLADVLLKGDYSRMDEIGTDFRENFLLAIEKIRSLNPDATLMVQTLYNPRDDFLKDAYQYAVNLLNNTVTEILTEQPGVYVVVDVAVAFEGHTEYIQKDQIHPNAAGHYVIAQEYIDTLLELGLGTAEKPLTEMPEAEQNNNVLLEFFKKVYSKFIEIINKIKTFFGTAG